MNERETAKTNCIDCEQPLSSSKTVGKQAWEHDCDRDNAAARSAGVGR